MPPEMTQMPKLAVAPVDLIRPHEEFDPFRVERLMHRIDADGTQLNPMVCAVAADGTYVLLDGATRREAFSKLGLPHAVVQIVDAERVKLETWHHVVQNGDPARIDSALDEEPSIRLVEDAGSPRITTRGPWRTVVPVEVSTNTALNALVDSYHGRMTVTRVTDPAIESVSNTHEDWVAIVEFPALTLTDVMTAAIERDFVPAGITRFIVPERALRLNVPLSFLREDSDTAQKQQRLDSMLAERAREGRVRRYDEPVVILDD